ncbi:MAG: hypothetical protein Q8N88_04465 [Nanoarchaeota archaeon]|nr:hypothetical protein [Nanoarchaeota archaeon]
MASKDDVNYSKKIIIPVPDKFNNDEEIIEFGEKLCRTYLAVYGQETKILINKTELEKILKNLPEDLNQYEIYKKNFYLVETSNGNNTKISIKYLNEKNNKLNKDEETRILVNKRDLEKILKDLPENCPICKLKFSENNFYWVDISSGSSTETYIECLCEDYRDVVIEMR